MRTSARLSRRTVLGLAGVGAVGATALRSVAFGSGRQSGLAPPGAAAANGTTWASPLDQPRALAGHLLRRAGFAPSSKELDEAATMPYGDLVDKVVSTAPDALSVPAGTSRYTDVVTAWYRHMATTAAQFPERMTLFWHGLLTSDYRKANGLPFVAQQNALYRDKGTSDMRSLLLAVTSDPLMMRYLDLDASSAKAPNENYSRELMELFTLGVGNFDESDVREGARALSGMRVVFVDPSGAVTPLPKRPQAKNAMDRQRYEQQIADLVGQGYSFRGQLDVKRHDGGTKSYLGRTGNLGADDVIDAILARDACAPFLANKVLEYFATPAPSRNLVANIAKSFRSSGYDIKTLMRAVFNSSEFKAGANYRSLVRSPVDYMVATMRVLGRADLAEKCVNAGRAMDQALYDMPTVGGWPLNAGWVSSSAWLARLNFSQTVVSSTPSLPDPGRAVADHLDGVVGPDTATVFDASTTTTDKWYALLASPEFHLK